MQGMARCRATGQEGFLCPELSDPLGKSCLETAEWWPLLSYCGWVPGAGDQLPHSCLWQSEQLLYYIVRGKLEKNGKAGDLSRSKEKSGDTNTKDKAIKGWVS